MKSFPLGQEGLPSACEQSSNSLLLFNVDAVVSELEIAKGMGETIGMPWHQVVVGVCRPASWQEEQLEGKPAGARTLVCLSHAAAQRVKSALEHFALVVHWDVRLPIPAHFELGAPSQLLVAEVPRCWTTIDELALVKRLE